jgi:drug/metabolite transporter (DMT)-like permease
MRPDNRLWFLALCLFWGGTWLAVKVTVTEVPPLMVACTRALLSGIAMLAIAGPGPARLLFTSAPWRVSLVALLTTTVSFAAVFWGTARLSTGVSAIVNNATVPIGLLVFGYLFREETVTRRQVVGIVLGIVGLGLLFARRTGGNLDTSAIAGLVGIVGGTLGYCLGSVLARPLLRATSPMTLGGLQMLIGGLAMGPIVWLLEGPTPLQFATLLSPVPLLGITWMVFAGGVGATFIYLRLIRDWGPTRAGMYAFVTPIIATALGSLVLHERLGAMEVAGAVVLLSAAALAIPHRSGTADRDAAPESAPNA